MINPSAVKGIQIFLALADLFPDLQFAGLTGWATTTRDVEEMSKRLNVTILRTVPRIDDVLSQSRLLLMPSLWYEGFGLIAVEAMLRGLPVIASDSGGLQEAKSGTGFVIPVRPIERFEPAFDETRMPRPVVVPQNIEPWAAALQTLTTTREAYENESRRSREVALKFVSGLGAGDFEDMLMKLTLGTSAVQDADKATRSGERMSQLSSAKRALLLQRLRGREKR
jgi:glycosyltransferase involved in cell wall biosynthesis